MKPLCFTKIVITILFVFCCSLSCAQNTFRPVRINGYSITPLLEAPSNENIEVVEIIDKIDSIQNVLKYWLIKKYYVVQFSKPITPDLRSLINREHIQFLEYIGNNTYVMKMTNRRKDWLSNFSFVTSIFAYPSSVTINPIVREQLDKLTSTNSIISIQVLTYHKKRNRKIKIRFKKIGAIVNHESYNALGSRFEVKIPAKAITSLLKIPGIRKISLPFENNANQYSSSVCSCSQSSDYIIYNDTASNVIKADLVRNQLGLSGSSQIINISDSGLDIGENNKNIHEDFQDQIVAIKSWPVRERTFESDTISKTYLNDGEDDGAMDFYGHGTHVAGSAVGTGIAFRSDFPRQNLSGIAPGAGLVFNAFEQTTRILLKSIDGNKQYEYRNYKGSRMISFKGQDTVYTDTIFSSGIPRSSQDYLLFGKNNGAKIHSNSFGSEGGNLRYSIGAEEYDLFSWMNPTHLILNGAGNSGEDNDGDGIIDLGSIGLQAAGKNVLSIGNTWNSLINPDSASVSSSRGPAFDGRIKPDLVVPGHWILSTKSSLEAYNTAVAPSNASVDTSMSIQRPLFSNTKSDTAYKYSSGTSMATPIAAGAAALIREYLTSFENMPDPSSGLIKALMIHGAQNLHPKASRVSGITGYPDNVQGWGRLDLEASLIVDNSRVRRVLFDDQKGITSDGFYRDTIYSSGRGPIIATLVYNDYPGERLINDLNLWIETPNGRKIFPNGRSSNPSSENFGFDTVNNIEKIVIDYSARGLYILHVDGNRTPSGRQPFALVYEYPQQGENLPPIKEPIYQRDYNYTSNNCKAICQSTKREKKQICKTFKKERKVCKKQARKVKKSCKQRHKTEKKTRIKEVCKKLRGAAKRNCKRNAKKNLKSQKKKCKQNFKESKKVCKVYTDEFKECKDKFQNEFRGCKQGCPPGSRRSRDRLHIVEPKLPGLRVEVIYQVKQGKYYILD